MRWLYICYRPHERSAGACPQAGGSPPGAIGQNKCLIVTNREGWPRPEVIRELRERAGDGPWYAIGADGGAALASAMGILPDVVVGDMDSLSVDDQRALRDSGARFIVHPAEKDETDLHLALAYAFEAGFSEAVVLFDSRGRLDHVLGGIWAACRYVENGRAVYFVDAGLEAALLNGPGRVCVRGHAGLTVSLIPISGTATGITLTGMKYPLRGETLRPGESRGISNQVVGGEAVVEFEDGILLVVASNG